MFRVSLLGVLALALTSSCAAPHGGSHLSSDVVTASEQAAMTPDSVLAELRAGNERFVQGRSTARDHLAQAEATAAGQYPKAVVLSCLDSRVVPELVFDQGLGDLFVGRIAGNFENPDMLGSMEFATAAAGSKLVVVLGHTSCGAIKGAADGVELGNLTGMLRNFDPALATAAAEVSGQHDSKNAAYVDAAIEANVRRTMADIVEQSDVLAGLVREGRLAVVGGVYDLATGRVRWL